MRIPIMIAALACSGLGATAGNGFTDSQLALARAIGAVIRLTKVCEVPIPSSAIAAAMRKERVPISALTDEATDFRATIQEQANTVAAIQTLRMKQGQSGAANREEACAALMKNYGPNGTIRRGLYQTR